MEVDEVSAATFLSMNEEYDCPEMSVESESLSAASSSVLLDRQSELSAAGTLSFEKSAPESFPEHLDLGSTKQTQRRARGGYQQFACNATSCSGLVLSL